MRRLLGFPLKGVEVLFLLLSLSVKGTSQAWENYSTFSYVNSISHTMDRLILGTLGGVVVLNRFSGEVIAAYVTEEPVRLAAPDPFTQDVYYISDHSLYRFSPFFRRSVYVAQATEARSLAVGRDAIYVEGPFGTVRIAKSGAPLEPAPPPEGLAWAGERANLPQTSPEVSFLVPFWRMDPGLGRVEYTVLYPEGNNLWVGTWGLGVYRYDRNTWAVLDSFRLGLASCEVAALAFAGNSLWIGGPEEMPGGITRWAPQGPQFFSRNGELLLPCDQVRDIFPTPTQVLFATDCGLLSWSQERSFRPFPGLRIRRLTAVAALGDRIYLGGPNGGLLLQGPSARTLFEGAYVNDILPSPYGVLFLTSHGVVIVRGDSTLGFLQDPRNHLAGNVESGALFADTLYLAGTGDLTVFYPDTFFYRPLPFDPATVPALDMAVDGRNYYFATPNGLYVVLRGGGWRLYRRLDGLADDFTESLLLHEGKLFVGTRLGLSVTRVEDL